jgi:hypothetical protein
MEPIKDAFRRLIGFRHAAKERAVPVWKVAVLRSEPALQWLKQSQSVAGQDGSSEASRSGGSGSGWQAGLPHTDNPIEIDAPHPRQSAAFRLDYDGCL